jgi:chromosome segregation ATPase
MFASCLNSLSLLRYTFQDAFSDMAHRDLRATLQSLSDQSLKTSRRLDDTYYSILEKVSVLRQTIGSLQELSGLTKELHDNFEADTTELVEDVTGQVEAFDGFQAQQQQVSDLEDRLKAGQETADSLTARLAKAKERVDARAESEAQWQATNTRMAILSLSSSPSKLTSTRSRAHLLGHSRLHSRRHLHSHPISPVPTGSCRRRAQNFHGFRFQTGDT